MSQPVRCEHDGNVAVVMVNNPPVNALGPGVPEGIAQEVRRAQEDGGVGAIVLIGEGRSFIAGADIKEFAKMTSGKKAAVSGIRALLDTLEGCPKPVVCAIHGTALGGGLEVAMACHFRVAVPTAVCGQPEVNLGLMPGAGGTQRLPRLIGIVDAAEMCATGKPISTSEAHRRGLVDEVIDGELLPGAVAFARVVSAATAPPPRTRDRDDNLRDSDEMRAALAALREKVGRHARGQIAPLRAIDAVEAAATLPFEEGLELEAELFRECLFSDQSKALIHVFFGERAVRKVPDIPRDTPLRELRRAAVVGAGTMGCGIAMSYVNAGIPTLLRETDRERLDRGMGVIRSTYQSASKKGRLAPGEAERRLALLTPTLTYDGFEAADIIVEAVFENMELKKQVFGELDGVARPEAILATNTSTLDIDEIASATGRPEAVIGHHFFSPANVMRLLEIVRGKRTADDVIATSMALAKRLGKVGVLVGNCTGFVGNRMFGPYMREAQFLVEEGATIEAVDAALHDFGMAMGPLRVGDLAGLDVGWRIRKEHRHLEPEGMRQPLVADRLCEKGCFGQKTGSGWYRYEEGKRAPIADPEVDELIARCSREAGIERRAVSRDEIIERTLYALINEGARILADGFARRAVDIDIIYAHGYGFPSWRGGPMFHADTVGLQTILDRLRVLEREQGFWWKPAGLIESLAGEGKTFADLDRG